MSKLKNILIILAIGILPVLSFAQQSPQFTQYMYNAISINPAYAGSREVMVINLLHRNQWIGVEGAPITQTLSAHTSIPNTKLGVGISAINDKLGYEKSTDLYANVSYTIDLDSYDEYKIAFGVNGGFRKYSLDSDLLNDPEYNNDPFLNDINYNWYPNVGFGVYFRGDSFYLGASAPKLFNYSNKSEYFDIDEVSYYFNGGYLFDVNPSLIFKPSFVVKYTEGAPVSFDFATMFLLNENLWLGASYRVGDSFGAIANFKVSKGFSVGYAYEFITSKLGEYTTGSHEIILSYEFEFPKARCKCKHLYN